jgi:hypothetical protein
MTINKGKRKYKIVIEERYNGDVLHKAYVLYDGFMFWLLHFIFNSPTNIIAGNLIWMGIDIDGYLDDRTYYKDVHDCFKGIENNFSKWKKTNSQKIKSRKTVAVNKEI